MSLVMVETVNVNKKKGGRDMRKLIEDIIQYQTGNILVDLFCICGLFVIPIIITEFELERTQSSESVLSMYFKNLIILATILVIWHEICT